MILINNLYVFGTIVNIYFNHNSKAEAEILKLLYGLDDLCSIYKDDSDISKNNSSTDYVEVDPKVYQLLKSSIHYCDLTSGYSDITIKPLIDSINNNQDIKVSLSLVNYKNILLKEPNLVKLKKKGMGIDLGSMVKGYATDLIVNILDKYHIADALIDLGGNIYVKGLNNGALWRVGIQDPFQKERTPIGYLDLTNKSIVTSGTNERGNHIINPKTGKPATDIKSITIIADKSFDAEGLSTGCFVQGLDSLNLLENYPSLSAIIIDNNRNVYLTNDLNNKFFLTNKKFKIKER